MAAGLFHADGQRTDIKKLTLGILIFAKAPKKVKINVQTAEIWTQLDQDEI